MLEFYLITTLLSITGDIVITSAINKRAKRDGYISVDKKESLPEKIVQFLQATPHMLIPIWNMLFPILGISKFESFYEYFVTSELEKGNYIQKPQEEPLKIEKNDDNISEVIHKEEDRFLLDSKTKTDFFRRITDLLIQIENIEDKEIKKDLIIKLKKVTSQFNQANKKLESLSPEKNHLLLENKVTIEIAISNQLDELENICNNLIRKQERINNDSEEFEKIFKKINNLQSKR